MPGIRTGIELQDNFSDVLERIVNGVYEATYAMTDLQQSMNANINTAPLQGAREQVQQTVDAVENLQTALNTDMDLTPQMDMPDIAAPDSIDTAREHMEGLQESIEHTANSQLQLNDLLGDLAGQVINVDVTPVLPDPLVENPETVPLEVQPNAPPEPVEVPIQWQSDDIEVFTNTGIERFRSEVQSTNEMLNTLNQTQEQIAQTANGVDILPDAAIQDISAMTTRLQQIQQRVQQIENNPLNMGTDEANAELEQLRGQLAQAIQAQNNLNSALDNLDVEAANEAYLQLSQTVGSTERYIRDNVNEQGQFNQTIQQGTDYAGELRSMIGKAVGAFVGIAGIKKAFSWVHDTTDAFNTQMNAEMQLMTVLANTLDADYQSTYGIEAGVTADTTEAINEINGIQAAVDEVTVAVNADTTPLLGAFDTIKEKAAEIQSRGIYGDEAMLAGAAEFATYFNDTDAITMMMDTLADYAMGMSGGGELDAAAMTDYATGLGKIMTGSYDAMTKKGFEFTEAQKAVIEGSATQAQIIEAIGEEYLGMSEQVQQAAAITAVIEESWAGLYENMSNTPEGQIIQLTNAWGDMKEMIGGQLYPYVLLFVQTIQNNWGTIEAVVGAITEGLSFMLGVLASLVDWAFSLADVIANNWNWISPLIWGIIAALGVYAAYLGIVKAAEIAGLAVKGALAVAEFIQVAALAAQTGATISATAAQLGLNGAMYACPIVWIIVLIIALIAIIYAVCAAIADMTGIANTGFGVITGGVNVVIQFFKNLGLEIANIALGIGNAIAAVASNIMTAFHNAICSVQSWWYDLLSTVLTVVAGICEALNKLPFVEFDYSGITAAADDFAAKSAEAAGNKEEYKSIGEAFNEGYNTFDTFQDGWVSDAFNAGAAWGDGVMDGLSDLTSGFSADNLFGVEGIPTAEDYAASLNNSGIGSGIDDIAGKTGDIANSLDITSEEMKYLRDIAEQEAVNRFTTAEIKIDQTNHNTISSGMDLDGVVNGLTDAVNEAVEIVTEGVHD